ncbi:MAG: hypothetical protein JO041_05815 [Acidobacteria bacterium]|nr:hypothetical protein [Acidobacteriota bacterium]
MTTNATRASLVAATVAAFMLAASFAPAQVVRSKNGNDLRPNGKHQGIDDPKAPPAQDIADDNAGPSNQASRSRGSGNGINYHGGPVMLGTVNVYFIWYGNWSGNTATSLLPTLISDLSGSKYEHINTSYYNGSNQHVAGLMNLSGQQNDNYTYGTALSDQNIYQVVASHCPSLGGCDTNGIYFVLTSSDVNETSGFCTQYCGWHDHSLDGYTSSGPDIKFAFVGNPARCLSACAAQSTSPNGNPGADGMASIIAHESEEAISDPLLNAWYDSRGEENADKCAWTFGTLSTAANGSYYNFTGASKTEWLIQRNWVNASGGYCSMSY